MKSITFITFIMLIFLILIAGGLLAATPWLMRKRECFAVSVPASAHDDSRITTMKKRYSLIVSTVTAVCALITVAVLPFVEANETAFAIGFTILVLAQFAFGFCLMLYYRKKVQALKTKEGWVSDARIQQTVATLGHRNEEVPRALSLWWDLLFLPIIALLVVIPLIGYRAIPDQLVFHLNFSGNPTDFVPKSVGSVLFPALVAVVMAFAFVIAHASIAFSKRPLEPDAPVISEYAYGLFARTQSILLVIGGLAISALIGTSMLLTFFGIISLAAAGILIIACVIPFVACAIIISVHYGQNGSKVFKDLDAMPEYDTKLPFDDDEHWKLGVFYFNRDDSAVFLPKRFGVGWTSNFARPLTWVIIGGLVAIIVALFVFAMSIS